MVVSLNRSVYKMSRFFCFFFRLVSRYINTYRSKVEGKAGDEIIEENVSRILTVI